MMFRLSLRRSGSWRPAVLIVLLSVGTLALGYRLFILPQIATVPPGPVSQTLESAGGQIVTFDAQQIGLLLRAALPEDFPLKEVSVCFSGDTAVVSGTVGKDDLQALLSSENEAERLFLESALLLLPDPVHVGLALRPEKSEQGRLSLTPVSILAEKISLNADYLPDSVTQKLEKAFSDALSQFDGEIQNAYIEGDTLVLVLQ